MEEMLMEEVGKEIVSSLIEDEFSQDDVEVYNAAKSRIEKRKSAIESRRNLNKETGGFNE